MRSAAPDYDLRALPSLRETLDLMAREPGEWRPFAGGTDLMVLFEAGRLPWKKLVSLRHLEELRGIEETATHVAIGALTTYTEVRASATLGREFPSLCAAAAETGAVAIQNRGTLGGNIANASPAADSSPALLAYDAALDLVSARGVRTVPYASFHTGYKQTLLAPDELLLKIRLPRGKPAVHYFRKVGTRAAQAISKVVIAAAARLDGGVIADARLALGSVAPTPVRCFRTEEALRGKKPGGRAAEAAAAALQSEIAPIDDIRSTAAYRRRVAENLLVEFLSKLASRAP